VLWAKNQTGKTLKRVISNNGGEFKNLFFEDFCQRRGIVQQFAPAYTPQDNGVAEQFNHAILDKACCIFAQDKLSPRYWGEAVITATDLCNLLPSSTRDFLTPYKTWFGRPCPNLSKLCAFGCLAYVLIPEQLQTSKLQPRCEKGIFLGYVNDFST
jgi:transposase InsO family protein